MGETEFLTFSRRGSFGKAQRGRKKNRGEAGNPIKDWGVGWYGGYRRAKRGAKPVSRLQGDDVKRKKMTTVERLRKTWSNKTCLVERSMVWTKRMDKGLIRRYTLLGGLVGTTQVPEIKKKKKKGVKKAPLKVGGGMKTGGWSHQCQQAHLTGRGSGRKEQQKGRGSGNP